jgi:hypothetical protein
MQMLIPTSKSSSSSKDSSSSGADKLGIGSGAGAGESTLSRALKAAEDKHQPFAQVIHTCTANEYLYLQLMIFRYCIDKFDQFDRCLLVPMFTQMCLCIYL